MTSLESIYEIRTAVYDLEKSLLSGDPVVSEEAQRKYEDLVDRFFRENENYLAKQQKIACIYDAVFFMLLIESAIEFFSKKVN